MLKKILCLLLTPVTFLANLIYYGIYTSYSPAYSGVPFPEVGCPPVEDAYASLEEALAAGGGWYVTMDEEFDGDDLPWPWNPSPHGRRNTEYWCSNMIDAGEPGKVKIYAMHADDNICAICPAEGDFTSGIETRFLDSARGFEQAFGYYEARVYLPEGPGLWSAFWLQTNSMGQLGSRGRDGSEIDIYESSFRFDPAKLGNCVHWDGYADYHGSHGAVTDTGVNQYGGWHTYGLLWTPKSYTFFLDGRAIWQTDAGGVSRVPSFLRLTVEIRHTEYGPYGAVLGEFANTRENPSVFEIDYVKVYQNTKYLKAVRQPDDFWVLRPPLELLPKWLTDLFV